MLNLFNGKNGMNIVGQGGKIILFAVPFAVAAILISNYFPKSILYPSFLNFIRPAGWILLISGLLLWIAGVIQLLLYFPKGKLITNGAYGICRNPIYSSFIVFIVPGISILTFNWSYLFISVFLYMGVAVFIGKEENLLLESFGKDYTEYMKKVSRVLPFIRPGKTKQEH